MKVLVKSVDLNVMLTIKVDRVLRKTSGLTFFKLIEQIEFIDCVRRFVKPR